MTEKSIVAQIIEFLEKHEEKVNKESFAVIEFVIQKRKLDGMRIKEYIKNKEEK